MKKEKSPILVVACIFLLLSFIIIPPVFRKFIPVSSQEESVSNGSNSISVLQCNRIFATELYQVSVRVKYLNHNISSNTITYQKLETLPEEYQEAEIVVPVMVLEEYDYLSQVIGIEKQGEEPNPTLVITQEVITMNPEDDTLQLYFQEDISDQQSFYEQRGYSCNIIET